MPELILNSKINMGEDHRAFATSFEREVYSKFDECLGATRLLRHEEIYDVFVSAIRTTKRQIRQCSKKGEELF